MATPPNYLGKNRKVGKNSIVVNECKIKRRGIFYKVCCVLPFLSFTLSNSFRKKKMQTATNIEPTITKRKFDNTLSGKKSPIEESISMKYLIKNPLKMELFSYFQ